MISKPIPYGRQHITDEDIRAVIDTLKSDYLTQGPKISHCSSSICCLITFLPDAACPTRCAAGAPTPVSILSSCRMP